MKVHIVAGGHQLIDQGGKAMTETIAGRNQIREALRAGRPLNKILLASHLRGRVVKEITYMARTNGIPIQRVERAVLDNLVGDYHQGIIALAAAKGYVDVDYILDVATKKQENPFIIMLDQVEDPRNLGAILRSADACGAHGVIIPRRRSVGLTPAAAKASAGAMEYVPVARVTNLARAMDDLKAKGVWVIGADGQSEKEVYDAELTMPLVLVLGGEDKGLTPFIKSHCDYTIKLPMRGHINSLNVATAATVLMYEVVRQRGLNRP